LEFSDRKRQLPLVRNSDDLRPMQFTSIAALLIILLADAVTAAPTGVLIPPGWITVSSPEDLVEAVKGFYGGEPGSLPQQAMNRELSLLGQIRDQELLNTYLKLASMLHENERQKLLAEQTAWLDLRDKKSREASLAYEGGTMAPAAYGKTYLDMTLQRNKILTSRMTLGTRSLSSGRK